MCNSACLAFGRKYLDEDEIRGQNVLEIGSRDVNGSMRRIVKPWGPGRYIGVDIESGPGVDLILDACNLMDAFSGNEFDLVISTEMLEHVENWKKAIREMKRVCSYGGVIIITTRSPGFRVHGYPEDYWRFTKQDMRVIFSDFTIEAIEKDRLAPGVFIKARKPLIYQEADLSKYEVMAVKA